MRERLELDFISKAKSENDKFDDPEFWLLLPEVIDGKNEISFEKEILR